jgi:hypothetical protein
VTVSDLLEQPCNKSDNINKVVTSCSQLVPNLLTTSWDKQCEHNLLFLRVHISMVRISRVDSACTKGGTIFPELSPRSFSPVPDVQSYSVICKLIAQCGLYQNGPKNMRLVQFCQNGCTRIGAEVAQNGDIVDLSAVDASIPSDTRSFLEAGESALLAASRLVYHN